MGKHRDRSNRTPKITLGKTQFSKIGLPRYEWHDIYHLTLTLSWPVFLAVIGAIKVYSASDIRWGKKFVDILSTTPDGKRLINYSGFHEVESLGSRGTQAERSATSQLSLSSILALFFKIGAIGFGGGMAVIAIMEREFVQKRRQLPPEEFLSDSAYTRRSLVDGQKSVDQLVHRNLCSGRCCGGCLQGKRYLGARGCRSYRTSTQSILF